MVRQSAATGHPNPYLSDLGDSVKVPFIGDTEFLLFIAEKKSVSNKRDGSFGFISIHPVEQLVFQ